MVSGSGPELVTFRYSMDFSLTSWNQNLEIELELL